MRRFLLVSLAILFSTLSAGLFAPYSASSLSVFDNTITAIDKLVINPSDGGDTRDYSIDWYTEAIDSLTARCDEGFPGQYCANRDLLVNMLDSNNANWAVIQPNPYEYQIIFSENQSSRVEFISLGNGNTEARLVSDDLQSFVVTSKFAFLNSAPAYGSANGTVYFDQGAFTVYDHANIGASYNPNWKVFLSTFPVVYPPDYDGDIIPDTWNPTPQSKTDPLIDWILTDKLEFSARYLKNLDPMLFANTVWTWKIYNANESYEVQGDPIYTSPEIQNDNRFVYQFDQKGYYVARATLRIPAPGLPPPPEYRTSIDIQLDVDGYYQTGGTNNCKDGICTVPPVKCSIQPTFLHRLQCQTEQMFDRGLINPSLIAFRNLISSFVVPADPVCSIPLGTVPLAPGKSFDLSGYSTVVCTRAADLRHEFPIVPVAVNFTFAMLLLSLIVRIFNRLTDNTKHDLIEDL